MPTTADHCGYTPDLVVLLDVAAPILKLGKLYLLLSKPQFCIVETNAMQNFCLVNSLLSFMINRGPCAPPLIAKEGRIALILWVHHDSESHSWH